MPRKRPVLWTTMVLGCAVIAVVKVTWPWSPTADAMVVPQPGPLPVTPGGWCPPGYACALSELVPCCSGGGYGSCECLTDDRAVRAGIDGYCNQEVLPNYVRYAPMNAEYGTCVRISGGSDCGLRHYCEPQCSELESDCRTCPCGLSDATFQCRVTTYAGGISCGLLE